MAIVMNDNNRHGNIFSHGISIQHYQWQ